VCNGGGERKVNKMKPNNDLKEKLDALLNDISRSIIMFETENNTNKKGKKQLDVCFIKNDIIYYFECKINMNLDSEKSKQTDAKIKLITEYLKNKYNKQVISKVITCWYNKHKGLLNKIKTNVIFMNEFFDLIDYNTDEIKYYKMMEDFGKLI
jgi:hypothetical protein